MAIKKAKVNLSQIATATPVALPDGTSAYPVRFRLTSDDKNRKSQWSPIYLVRAPEGFEVFYQSIDGGDNIVD
jgi:hypothetical protein